MAPATYPEVSAAACAVGPRVGAPGRHAQRPNRGLAAVPSLFGLAPCGVYPAPAVTSGAVRSYRTFSPLPAACPCGLTAWRYVLCGTGRPRAFTPGSRTLSGTLPFGVRTFLPRGLLALPRQRSPGCLLSPW